MPLTIPQTTVFQNPARFRVLCAGRRFGKTYLLTSEIAYAARVPDRKVWAIYPSYRMAKQILWKPLKKRLLALNWVKSINESDLTILLVNDSEISLRSADNYDSLRGVGLNFVALDEFADMEPEVWTEVIRPTLSDTGGRALFAGTPKGVNHFKDLFDQYRIDPDTWASFRYTTIEGGNVPAAELEAARRDLDERTYRQEYEATFENYSGRIYYAFDEANIVKWIKPEQPIKELLLFCDFNIDPMTGILVVRTRTGLHCIDEIVMNGSNTAELAQEVKNRYPGIAVTAFPDPAGSQRKTSAGGMTDITILQKADFKVLYHRSHPPVKDRINAVNSLLCSSTGERRLLVDPRCRKLIDSLYKHCFKEGTQVPDKNSGYDHATDALGYGVEFLFPIKRDIDTRGQPDYWAQY